MSGKYQVNDHSVLKVTKEEAKQGKSWHDIAKGRAHKQHGEGEEIPDGDIHAVRKHPDHILPHASPEETNAAIGTLEDQIKKLQANEEEKAKLRQQKIEERHQVEEKFNDELDDWFKE